MIGFFLSSGPQRLWNMRYSAPAPPIAASFILLAIWGKRVLFLCWQNTYRPFWGVFRGGQAFFLPIWGQNYVQVRPYALNLRVFVVLSLPIVILFFCIFILIHFSYSSLLISSYFSRTILPLLIFLFLNLNYCIVDIHIKLTLGSFGQRNINKRQN